MLKSKVQTTEKCRHTMFGARSSLERLGAFTLLLGILASFPVLVFAEHTRSWRQSTYDEFLKGTATGVAVRSDGRLELSPRFKLISDADASYLWSARVDPQGVLYAAGGAPAKVFRFDASGKPSVAFESTDLAAQAIAFDAQGNLYVATSPDGKVYRVSASGEKSVFFDPKTKYIWDLLFGTDGTLYVATGDKGQVLAVSPEGKSELLYNSDEAHIRVLAFDPRGSLLAGTEPSGRVLRITRITGKDARKDRDKEPAATGFVIYETAKREVTSLAVAPDGNIYVSAIGEKQRPGQSATVITTTSQGVTTITGPGTVNAGTQQNATPFIPFPPLLSSSIYRLSPDGAPEELWTSRDDVVYTLALNSDGRLLAGTGNNGALLAVDGRGVFAQLAKSGSAQITSITRSASGKIYLCTANPGKVFSVGPEYEPEGTYESRSFDAQLFSQWGRLEWWGPPPAAPQPAKSAVSSKNEPRLEFFARSGNTEDPGKEWSRWFGPYSKPSTVECPAARFVQWKAVIHDGRPGDGIDWVNLAYLPRNVAPVIDGIAVQDPGVRAQGANTIQSGQQPAANLKMPLSSGPGGVLITQSTPARFEQPPQGFTQKGYASVLWSAHDENDDELRFAVYYRGENEMQWKLLKDKLDQRFYSWDATALPDGAYYLKITASDATSNPPAAARGTERESERFVIDNTPPAIEGFSADALNRCQGQSCQLAVTVKFVARDATSSIERAQYSIDGGDWILVAPTGNVSDSTEERYQFSISVSMKPGEVDKEHSFAVRAYDHFDNVGSAKTTITAGTKQ
jgi:outer membrane protein assembly factor BamB